MMIQTTSSSSQDESSFKQQDGFEGSCISFLGNLGCFFDNVEGNTTSKRESLSRKSSKRDDASTAVYSCSNQDLLDDLELVLEG
jgi:hypothetical protein